MKIAFFTKYHKDGASSRCRSYQYAPYIEAAGHECAFFPLMYKGYVAGLFSGRRNRLKKLSCAIRRVFRVLAARRTFDLLVIEKELVHGMPYCIERMLLGRCAYTLDFDDAHALRYRSNPVRRRLLGEKINRLSARARLTTVGNRWYFTHITKGTLAYLPTVVDAAHYPLEGFQKKENDALRIVWIGNPGTLPYLEALVPLLTRLSRTHRFILRVIGAKLQTEGLHVEQLPWDHETEFLHLAQSDIGIMPLSGSEWENGKCGYKLIQYMAAGLPTVAAPAAANKEITIEDETGFLASNDEAWISALSSLLTDAPLRRRMGEAGRARIEAFYALQVWAPRYVSMLETASTGNLPQ